MKPSFSLIKYLTILFSLLFATQIFAADTSHAKAKPVSDSDITAQVKSKVAADPTVSNATITITSKQGTVTLAGTVNSEDQASRLTQIAQSSDGVKDVDASELKVSNSTQPLTDTLITAKIKGWYIQKKLFTDQDIAAMKVNVETKNGVVYLTGTVDNSAEMKNAVRIAKKVDGVKDILNNLKVANQ